MIVHAKLNLIDAGDKVSLTRGEIIDGVPVY